MTTAGTAPATGGAGQSLLGVSGLRHAYGERTVLDGLSFGVARGELFGLLGPNGCGKSTTLRVLTGLLVPDAGSLTFGGEPTQGGSRRLRAGMGVVFQSPSLDPKLTARENLRLSAALYGIRGAEAARKVEAVLETAELLPRGDDTVSEYSGGMKRRLELSRALMHDPDLLVMDEPTTGLDESAFRRTWEHILELRRTRGLTVLFSTHRAEEAQLCDRVAIVDGGRIIAEGEPEVLRQRVAGDVLTLDVATTVASGGSAAVSPETLVSDIARRFEVSPRLVDGRIVIEASRGHELIPRLVEALPAGAITSLSMHRPTLADVFVQLTGRKLGDEKPTSEEN